MPKNNSKKRKKSDAAQAMITEKIGESRRQRYYKPGQIESEP